MFYIPICDLVLNIKQLTIVISNFKVADVRDGTFRSM